MISCDDPAWPHRYLRPYPRVSRDDRHSRRVGGVDALGHVNNVVYFRYLESSRIAFIRSLALDDVRNCPREGKSPLSLLKPA